MENVKPFPPPERYTIKNYDGGGWLLEWLVRTSIALLVALLFFVAIVAAIGF